MHPSPSRIVLVAATLVLSLGALPDSAAAQPMDLPADLPNAPVASTGYSSSLEEEAALLAKQRATPSFETIDKDWSGEQRGRAVAPSAVSAKNRFTKGSLESLKARLAGTPLGKDDAFGYYYDSERDVIVVSGNIDPNRLPKDAISAGQIEYTKTSIAGRLSRYSDSTPHWGGANIVAPGGSCSSGFNVRYIGSSVRLATTAGHCLQYGSTWYSNSYYYGVLSRASYPAYDIAILSGSSYGSSIYMGGVTGVAFASGQGSDPAINASYCTSGSMTFEVCGRVVMSLTAGYCGSDGCTYGLIAFAGGTMLLNGDSGAPLVLKSTSTVYPRGLVIAKAGTTMFAEKYSTVANYFGVTSG